MDDDNHVTTTDERIVAELVHSNIVRERDHALATVTSQGNWVLASLLAANSAGVAFAVSTPTFDVWSAGSFALGAMSALACGIFQWLGARIAVANLGSLINPAQVVDRRYARPVSPALNAPILNRSRIAIGFACISLACLFVATTLIGYRLTIKQLEVDASQEYRARNGAEGTADRQLDRSETTDEEITDDPESSRSSPRT